MLFPPAIMVEGKETAPFICVFICESVRSPTDELLKDATVLDQQFSGGNGSKDWGGGVDPCTRYLQKPCKSTKI